MKKAIDNLITEWEKELIDDTEIKNNARKDSWKYWAAEGAITNAKKIIEDLKRL